MVLRPLKAYLDRREAYEVLVVNLLQVSLRIFFSIYQSNPLYRSYFSHCSLVLEAGDSKPISVMHELDPSNLSNVPTRLGSHMPPVLVPINGADKESEAQGQATEDESHDLSNKFSIVV